MTLATIPDVEKVVSGYLRTHPDLVALSARVVGETPDSTDAGWIRLTQIDARSAHRKEHLIEAYLQLDCYASRKGFEGSQQADAARLKRAARAVLMDMPRGSLEGAEVSAVEVRGDARVPDSIVDEPARERHVLSVVVWLHP